MEYILKEDTLITRIMKRSLTRFIVGIAMAAVVTGGVATATQASAPASTNKLTQEAAALATKVVSGRTYPGGGWNDYVSGAGIWIQVDTQAAGFTATPTYVTSLGGYSGHWYTTGGTSVYPPDASLGFDLKRGFRIFVRSANGEPLTPYFAYQNSWYINWIATD